MSHRRRALGLTVALALSPVLHASPAAAAEGRPAAPASAPAAERCAHGVQKALCTRCNPKLAPVFKAKGDWCAEHARPETQCVPCHPELAKQGIQ